MYWVLSFLTAFGTMLPCEEVQTGLLEDERCVAQFPHHSSQLPGTRVRPSRISQYLAGYKSISEYAQHHMEQRRDSPVKP